MRNLNVRRIAEVRRAIAERRYYAGTDEPDIALSASTRKNIKQALRLSAMHHFSQQGLAKMKELGW